MSKITKKDAIIIVEDCAKKYRDILLNRNLLFILSDKQKKISTLEVLFKASNFLHLTGLKISKIKSSEKEETTPADFSGSLHKISASQFFRRCLTNELSENDFEFADDGTTELKLEILPKIIKPNLAAKSVGNYNNSKPLLITEKLAGGVNGCMGFCRDDNDPPASWFVPNTLLNEDIRELTNGILQIIATYRKQKSEECYEECVYLTKNKNIDFSKIKFPEEFSYLQLPTISPVPAEQTPVEES